MSNPQVNAKRTPVWQPLPQLNSVEIHTVEFQRSTLGQHKVSAFEAWALNEDQLLGSNRSLDFNAAGSVFEESADNSKYENLSKGIENQSVESTEKIDSGFLDSLKEEAFQKGILEGKKLQKLEFEAASEVQRAAELEKETALAEQLNLQVIDLLSQISKSANDLLQNPTVLHEPLKRLALHLAEQLTLTELSLSANGIENLIQRSIETLDLEHNASLQIELNPSDLAILQKHLSSTEKNNNAWRLISDPHLLPGSITVRADDSAVSDFVENRLESLAKSLLLDPSRWQAQSSFQPSRLSARATSGLDIEDALPRTATPVDKQLSDVADDKEDFVNPIFPSDQGLENDD